MSLSLGIGLGLTSQPRIVLGPELVTNGGFDTDTDWTKSVAGWTISGGLARKVGWDGSIYQNTASVITGRTYRVAITAVSVASGGCGIFILGTWTGVEMLTPDEYSHDVVAGAGGRSIELYGNGSSDGTFDNFSVRELL